VQLHLTKYHEYSSGREVGEMSKMVIGSDDAGLGLKDMVKEYLESLGYEIHDYSAQQGGDECYPDVAFKVASAIAASEFSRGILICGTGIGMAIVANKVGGVRAAVCHDTYSAERARKSNNAQILAMGARVIGPELAKSIVQAWLNSEFTGGSSTEKVKKMEMIDQMLRKTGN
jgi:ribose 5-phosphate isomerase B